MAAVLSEDVQVPAGAIDVPTSTETLVVVSSPLTLPGSNAKAVIRGWLDLTVGAATTAITIAVYEGGAIGGRLVGTKQPSAGDFTPGNDAHFEYETVDVIENVGGAQYCMSVTQTGATADGSVTAALLDTTLLSG
jgi:hypothetical protein